jgi:hypothetical protein
MGSRPLGAGVTPTKEKKSLTPTKAIHAECVYCMGGYVGLIKDCESTDCKLHGYRNGRKEEDAKLTPMKTIRAHCLDCNPEGKKAIRNCGNDWCNLYPFRLGKKETSSS